MKKKLGPLLACVLIAFLLCACEKSGTATRSVASSGGQSVSDVLKAGIEAEDAKKITGGDESQTADDITTVKDAADFLGITTEPDDTEDTSLTGEPDPDVDVDLTVMNSNLTYSEVYNMVTDPSSYIGKTVKMDGIFDVYTDESTGKNYYACIIQDATKCCSNGIEFELEKETVYPDDYPETGSIITVTGVFDIYEEDGVKYCTLRKAKMDL